MLVSGCAIDMQDLTDLKRHFGAIKTPNPANRDNLANPAPDRRNRGGQVFPPRYGERRILARRGTGTRPTGTPERIETGRARLGRAIKTGRSLLLGGIKTGWKSCKSC